MTVSEGAYPPSDPATQNDYSGNYFGWKTYATSGITGFIHFNGPYEVRNGSFVAYQGNVYESAVGHPLYAVAGATSEARSQQLA